MANVHQIKRGPTKVDIELASSAISEVSSPLGMLAMMAARVDDDEMVIAPRDLYGMMETLRGTLARAYQRINFGD